MIPIVIAVVIVIVIMIIINSKTDISGVTITNISDFITLEQGTLESEYLPVSFAYAGYPGNYDNASVIATFASTSGQQAEVYTHPFYYENDGETYTANTRFPDGIYNVTVAIDTEIPTVQNDVIEYSSSWLMTDFIRDHPTEPQLALKGGQAFYPAGFNAQYGTTLYTPGDPEYVSGSANFDPADYTVLIDSMSNYPDEWNYLRFNFSNDLHLLDNQDTNGIPGTISRFAANAINDINVACDAAGIGTWNVFFHRGGLNQMLLLWDDAPSAFSDQVTASWNSEWSSSIWYEDNNGPLNHPRDLTTTDTATDYFKNSLRYSIARWGYRTGWMIRELCAEVYLFGHNYDTTLPTGKADLESWYEGMKTYMESIDPYGQWIATGDGGTGTEQHTGANMDVRCSHLHHNPPVKPKIISISADSENLYAVYNHYTHPNSDYIDLTTAKYINGSMGNGQWIAANIESDKTSELFGITRALHDKHAYWENAFSGACGVGCSWDINNHLATVNTPAMNYASIRFAKSASFHEETHSAINNLTTDTGYYAMAMQNENKTAAYIFDIQSGSADISSSYYLTASAECPARTGVSVSIPVSFTGGFDARPFDCDTSIEDTVITGTVSSNTASVTLPSFNRAIALIVQPT